MPQEIKREAIRAAASEQKRLRRAQMTEEQLRKVRAAAAERVRRKRAQMTEEEIEIHRARDAQKKREKRSALKSEEELQPFRARKAEYTRRKRAQMTQEELQKCRARDAAKKREKRLARKSEDGLQQIRPRKKERKRQESDKMTEEEIEKAEANNVEYKQRKNAQMTEEELKKRNAKQEADRLRRAQMTEEQKEKLKLKVAERKRIKENGTTGERIRSMISVAGDLAHRHPARYEIPGTFIKNSLNDILTLHTTVEKLRMNLKQTVADAVKNAVSLHRIEKQTKTGGYRSHTFVEVSALPLFSKLTTQKEFTQSDDEEDPLLLQPDVQREKSCSIENRNANPVEEKTDETFKVCNYVDASENSIETVTSKKFQCPICSKKFETSLGLMIHEKGHSADLNEFKCPFCSEMFNSYNSITTHYIQVHSFEIDIDDIAEAEELDDVLERHRHEFEFSFSRKCLICFKSFEMEKVRLTTYRNHLIEDHSENKELLKQFTYSCTRCDKHFAVLRSLETHWKFVCFKKWKDENSREIVCEKCGMRFSNEKSLGSHSGIYHADVPEKNKVVCEQCGKECKDEKLLKMHVKAIHAVRQTIICEHCGKKFTTRQGLVKHTKSVHLGETRFTCNLCGKRFENNFRLDIHMNSHTGEKPFQCKYCDKSFGSKSGLENHERRHEGRVFKSRLAGQNSQRHVSKELKYACEICGKRFRHICLLKDHKYSHDAVPRFGCSLCQQTFTTKNYYYQHKLQKHRNEKGHVVKLIPDAETPTNMLNPNDPANSKHTDDGLKRFGSSLFGQTFQHTNNFYGHKDQNNRASENAQIMKFTAGDVFANLLPIRHDAAAILYNAPETRTPTFSNMRLEPQYSLEREDYSPEMDYDNDINVDDISLPQFEVGGLRNTQCAMMSQTSSQQDNISAFGSNNTGYSNSLQNSVSDTITEDVQQSVANSSRFIDFSRANVPSAISTMTEDGSNFKREKSETVDNQKASRRNEQKHKVFVEDSEKDSFVADFYLNGLLKIKIETLDGADKESTKVKDENQSSIFAKKNSSNKNPFVRLTRLLEHQCIPCDKTIFAVSQREILKHRRTHFKNESKKRSKYTFSSGKFMVKSFDCLYCDKKNVSCKEIVAHCRKEHASQKPLKCKQCPWMFNTIDAYYGHKNKKHNAPKPKPPPRDPNAKKEVICEECGKEFYTKQALHVHRSVMHRGNLEVECEICHKILRGKRNMKLHRNRHLGIKPHLCEECGLGFATKGELKQHVRVVHKGEKKNPQTKHPHETHPYACLLCPQRFSKETGLQQHQKLHDPHRKFPCEECGLRFATYDSIYSHRKVQHRGVKYYVRKTKPKLPADMSWMFSS